MKWLAGYAVLLITVPSYSMELSKEPSKKTHFSPCNIRLYNLASDQKMSDKEFLSNMSTIVEECHSQEGNSSVQVERALDLSVEKKDKFAALRLGRTHGQMEQKWNYDLHAAGLTFGAAAVGWWAGYLWGKKS